MRLGNYITVGLCQSTEFSAPAADYMPLDIDDVSGNTSEPSTSEPNTRSNLSIC